MKLEDYYTGLTRKLQDGGRTVGRLATRFIKAAPAMPALPPGSLVYRGEARTEPVRITVIDYDLEHHEQKEVERVEDCFPYRETKSTSWVNLSGVHDLDIIEKLGGHFHVHPLVLEDILHTSQRPKIEDHDHYTYIVLRMLQFGEQSGEVESEQVSLLLGRGWLLTFQEKAGDVFEPVRERVLNPESRLRKNRSDFLAYALIDAIVDHYFIVLEKVGDRIEALEEVIRLKPDPDALQLIHHLKREMIFMRRSIWPLREVVNQLYKGEVALFEEGTRLYLRDLYDHTVQIVETVESLRDMLSGLQDLYLSMVSNRMNEVMKVLTIIATIFIPLTFIAGIYGMNFDNMPELHTPFGYFVVLAVMLSCILGMLLFFRRKHWL